MRPTTGQGPFRVPLFRQDFARLQRSVWRGCKGPSLRLMSSTELIKSRNLSDSYGSKNRPRLDTCHRCRKSSLRETVGLVSKDNCGDAEDKWAGFRP